MIIRTLVFGLARAHRARTRYTHNVRVVVTIIINIFRKKIILRPEVTAYRRTFSGAYYNNNNNIDDVMLRAYYA